MEHLVEDDAEGPDVRLLTVALQHYALRGHVLRRSYIEVLEALSKMYREILVKLCQSEIGDDGSSLVHENVGRL